MLKTTPFTDVHIALGAKMAEFAGFNMPIQYPTGINQEHMIVREGVGVFDVSHMGEFWVKGEKALDFLQYITTNDLSVIPAGKAQYTCMPNGKGGIVDDLIIYKYSTTKYLMVVNAGNIDKDWAWVNKIRDEKFKDADLKSIDYYAFREWSFAGVPGVILSNTGYTGAGGFELYFPAEKGKQIWDALFEVGKPFGLAPIGLGARDSLRLEKWYCLYGHDIDDTTSPLEAGLGWITKLDAKDFIDRDFLKQQKAEGVVVDGLEVCIGQQLQHLCGFRALYSQLTVALGSVVKAYFCKLRLGGLHLVHPRPIFVDVSGIDDHEIFGGGVLIDD